MIVYGKEIAKSIEHETRQKLKKLKQKPCLAVVLVGDDAASKVYVKSKQKACEKVGITSRLIALPKNIKQTQLNEKIESLNADEDVNAVLLQLPLPVHLNAQSAISKISPQKDADGLTKENMGALMLGDSAYALPCTPQAIVKLIKSVKPNLEGKNICIVGRSNLVGKPLMHLFLKENATVTLCHSKTKNLKNLTKKADVLVSATGSKHLIGKHHIKKGAVVVDVGIVKDKNGKLAGDVNFNKVKKQAGFITPVPGGVGPVTIAQLLLNVVNLTLKQKT